MARFNVAGVLNVFKGSRRDPRFVARVVLGILVAANLVAAVIVLKPWAGSAEELERQASALRGQVQRKQVALERVRGIVGKVTVARSDGDHFMDGYLLHERSLSSKLLADLYVMARKAGIRQKEVAFGFEPIEGSDTLTKATITANYEGTYADLMHFLFLVDRSPRLLIIESLGAAPQPQGLALNITMKLNGFVREGGNPASEPANEELDAIAEAPQGPRRATGTAPDFVAPPVSVAPPVVRTVEPRPMPPGVFPPGMAPMRRTMAAPVQAMPQARPVPASEAPPEAAEQPQEDADQQPQQQPQQPPPSIMNQILRGPRRGMVQSPSTESRPE